MKATGNRFPVQAAIPTRCCRSFGVSSGTVKLNNRGSNTVVLHWHGSCNTIRMQKILLSLTLLIVLSATSLPASEQWQSLETIRETAVQFTATRFKEHELFHIEASRMDARLKLRRCDGSLVAFEPPGARRSGNTTVGVRCAGNQKWSLYVPVRVRLTGNVVVAKRMLARGERLTSKDVELARHDLNNLPYGYLRETGRVEGQVLRRPVAPGAVILPAMLDQPSLIERGQSVTLATARDGVQISMSGVALNNGALQQRIQVRNQSSGRVVEGVVRSAELVEIVPAGR